MAAAYDGADRIVVEVANLNDEAAVAAVFQRLSRSPALPPLAERAEPALRPALARMLRQQGRDAGTFANVDTWAAAVMLAQGSGADSQNSAYGVDRAVIAEARARPVVELEGAARQLAIFDTLPEREQRDLLSAVLRDAGALDDGPHLARAWLDGDMATIDAEIQRGAMADPELREALLTGRNRAWADRIAAMLARGERPFVAVGAAHMAGPDGLPALLAAKGMTVTRIQ